MKNIKDAYCPFCGNNTVHIKIEGSGVYNCTKCKKIFKLITLKNDIADGRKNDNS